MVEQRFPQTLIGEWDNDDRRITVMRVYLISMCISHTNYIMKSWEKIYRLSYGKAPRIDINASFEV